MAHPRDPRAPRRLSSRIEVLSARLAARRATDPAMLGRGAPGSLVGTRVPDPGGARCHRHHVRSADSPERRRRTMADTIFERYGGFAAVRRIVSDFYDRAVDSPVLSHHFEHVDMRRLLDHQARFISELEHLVVAHGFEHLRRIHERLGITTGEFREMLALLAETLEDFGFDQADVDVVVQELRRRQGVIVTR